MAKKDALPKFPDEDCGSCCYCRLKPEKKADKQLYCWVEPMKLVEELEFRGIPIEAIDPPCRDYKQRHNA